MRCFLLQEFWEQVVGLGWDAAIAAGIFFGVLLLGKFLLQNIFKILIRMSRKTHLDIDTKILLVFERPLQAFSLVLGFFLAMNYLPLQKGITSWLPESFDPTSFCL